MAYAVAIGKILWQITDAILPPRCAVSGAVVDAPGLVAPPAWAELRLIADPQCAACGYPFDFGTEAAALCGGCLRERPLYETARAALVYDESSRGMILKFKHGDQTENVRAFTPLMKRAGAALLARADVIVPVPLHRWRLLLRRYNQAALIGHALAKAAGKPSVPDALLRRRATKSQGHLGFRERHRNVKGAFAINPAQAGGIAGKTVLLVDDVYTSGATIRECTKVLLKAGAKQVDVLTLARVVRPEYVE